jgi:FixJ family two-component response regulator
MNEEIVYLVDDDAQWMNSIDEWLAEHGMRTRKYASAAEFLYFLSTVKIDRLRGCVLLDMKMPEMEGDELFRKLLAMGIRLPIAFLSSHVDSKKVSKLAIEGAATYITKTDKDLSKEVEKLLRRHRIFLVEFAKHQKILDRVEALDEKEHQVFLTTAKNPGAKLAAEALGVSLRTYYRVLEEVNSKLELRNLADLVSAYHEWQKAQAMRP